MCNVQEYYDRLKDLMDDMAGDEIDPMDVIFSIVAEYAEEELEGEEDKRLAVEYEDMVLVIGIESVNETNTARLH